MTSQTGTITRTTTVTHTDVRHIVWKIKSDMFQLRLFHSLFTEKYEDEMSADLFQWTYRGFAKKIRFSFYEPSTKSVKCEIAYEIARGQVIGADDDAGRIPFLDLAGTKFSVLIKTTGSWDSLSPKDKTAFYESLTLAWGPSSLKLSYQGGSWSSDKTYSSNSISATRSIYTG